MGDIPEMLTLINTYAAQGVMLPRTEFELAESIRDFTLAEGDSLSIGCAALHFYTPLAAEIRSLAVHPGAKGNGVGRALCLALEQEARNMGLASLFAFTYVPEFFRKLGYEQVDRALLPQKAWKDCLRCPKFQNCDEIAVHRQLHPIESLGPTNVLRVLPAASPLIPSSVEI
jgi:amino-acid N-acetyltransferase